MPQICGEAAVNLRQCCGESTVVYGRRISRRINKSSENNGDSDADGNTGSDIDTYNDTDNDMENNDNNDYYRQIDNSGESDNVDDDGSNGDDDNHDDELNEIIKYGIDIDEDFPQFRSITPKVGRNNTIDEDYSSDENEKGTNKLKIDVCSKEAKLPNRQTTSIHENF
ncbi:clumping factor A-like [Microplitis mediator]|uniref:clumping factor A-like n=1 Tax=Microplitis mediator TaxID=375433 RepID=UPI002556C94F|nr:clumping factor A-like [Microplitis mediator]